MYVKVRLFCFFFFFQFCLPSQLENISHLGHLTYRLFGNCERNKIYESWGQEPVYK